MTLQIFGAGAVSSFVRNKIGHIFRAHFFVVFIFIGHSRKMICIPFCSILCNLTLSLVISFPVLVFFPLFCVLSCLLCVSCASAKLKQNLKFVFLLASLLTLLIFKFSNNQLIIVAFSIWNFLNHATISRTVAYTFHRIFTNFNYVSTCIASWSMMFRQHAGYK